MAKTGLEEIGLEDIGLEDTGIDLSQYVCGLDTQANNLYKQPVDQI
ncbi:hypothetical protein HC752_01875 [Vibrio sp. S9_S30]|nr:hypothetical protein [Vibrio sp. S9_S30]MBD1555683.1 hypothetical protein [Vibrio sp. S9_S30]